ncbi:hypothetical protein HPP92_027781 [Vanilla planifolia]|uniref:J domain-containing protein n=1 Tax=Vanilla planifolia TaxID=51239 RepID=A0A835P7W6_VANPL|nr:hypothetical protein HPP92_027781 [Vanilla planifolia]KAG0448655.1 hypothetical protein HPP92_027737 [Vanilla planifolia]
MIASPCSLPILLGQRIAHPRRVSLAPSRLPLSSPLTAAADASAAPEASPSLYEVLDLSENATAGEIKAAYRRLARSCHPDAADAAGRRGDSSKEFIRIRSAYSTLSDPAKRAKYDREVLALRLLSQRYPPQNHRFSGHSSRRTWETDQCW